jgi:hypothetical protein
MTDIVPVSLSGGDTILARVTPTLGAGGGGELQRLPDPGTVTDFVRRVGDAIQRGVADVHPGSTTVEFGIEIEASGGIPILAQGKGTAHLTVTLAWGKTG